MTAYIIRTEAGYVGQFPGERTKRDDAPVQFSSTYTDLAAAEHVAEQFAGEVVDLATVKMPRR